MIPTLPSRVNLCVLVLGADKEPWKTWMRAQKEIIEKHCQGLPVDVFYMLGSKTAKISKRERAAIFLHNKIRRMSTTPLGIQLVSRIPLLRFLFQILLEDLTEVATFRNSEIVWAGPEDYSFMAQKTLASLQLILASGAGYTHVLRTNNSSMWDFKALVAFLGQLGGAEIYGGYRGDFGRFSFASGAGIILSRKYCEELVEARKKLAYQFVDDVTFGEFFHLRQKTKLFELGRQDAPFENQIRADVFHFRCKDGDKTVANLRRVSSCLAARNLR